MDGKSPGDETSTAPSPGSTNRTTLDAPDLAAIVAKIDAPEIQQEKAPPSKTVADPIAAAVSMLMGLAFASGLPSRFGVSTAMLLAVGGAFVTAASLGRAIWHWRRGEVVALQDKIAAALGAAIAIAAAAGLPVNEMSPDLVGTAAATIATIFTTRRAVKKS